MGKPDPYRRRQIDPTPSTSNSSITDEARDRLQREDEVREREREREAAETEKKRKNSGERRTVSEEAEGVQGAVGGFPEEAIPSSSLSAPVLMQGTGEGPGEGFGDQYESQCSKKARIKYAGHTPPPGVRLDPNAQLSESQEDMVKAATKTEPFLRIAVRQQLSSGTPVQIIQSPTTVSSVSDESPSCVGQSSLLNISGHFERREHKSAGGPFTQLIKRLSGHEDKHEDAIQPSTSCTYRKTVSSPPSALVALAKKEAASHSTAAAASAVSASAAAASAATATGQEDSKGKKDKEIMPNVLAWLKKKDTKRGDDSDSHSD